MADAREVIREAMQTHVDGSMRLVDRKWHAFCDCGADLGDCMGPLVDSSYDQPGRLHQGHLGEAIRAALADAGLLVEPGGTTRTEWGIASKIVGEWHWCHDRDRCQWPADSHTIERTVHYGPTRPASAILNDQHEGSTP